MTSDSLAALKAAYEAVNDKPLRADAAHRIHEVGIWQMNSDSDLLDQTLVAKTLDWPLANFIVAAHELTPALIARIEALEAALKPFTELFWTEDYAGVQTPNVRCFVPRGAIENAKKLLGEQEQP
jgi:hypothetical protein